MSNESKLVTWDDFSEQAEDALQSAAQALHLEPSVMDEASRTNLIEAQTELTYALRSLRRARELMQGVTAEADAWTSI